MQRRNTRTKKGRNSKDNDFHGRWKVEASGLPVGDEGEQTVGSVSESRVRLDSLSLTSFFLHVFLSSLCSRRSRNQMAQREAESR